MRAITEAFALAGRLPVGAWAAGQAGLWMFAATLLLSASLLFSIQPIFTKMVLPHLGGSPSVWAVAMCFFQATLLAGYCYAHALNRFAPWRWAPVIHLAVCAIAVFALPFGLPVWAHEPPTGNTYFWLVGVLTVGVGLPFFAVSANAPLLQAWFARSGHPHANDPYFLYGASNLGSLASLLAYPFLIEPLATLDTQRAVWAFSFVALMPLLGACACLMFAGIRGSGEDTATETQDDAGEAAPVTASQRLTWIGLAFLPSALLVAFTTHITTDIASAPFLWVIPLATFLGTFVIVFRDESMIPHNPVLRIHPLLVAAVLVMMLLPKVGGHLTQGLVGFATFVVTTLVCHRALFEARPGAAKLTEFYLYMSLGGVLGGMFAGLIAPQIFNTVVEYPLLILAGLLARPGVFAKLPALLKRSDEQTVAIGLVAGTVLLLGMWSLGAASAQWGIVLLGVAAAAALAVLHARPAMVAATGVGMAVLFVASANLLVDGVSERSFFGVSRVATTPDGKYRLFIHGSTLHGGERLVADNGEKSVKPPPIMYYFPGSPMARGFDVARSSLSADEKLNIGVVGLGTGSLTCHVKDGETLTFYEIDPLIDRIARNPKHFTYLSRCAPGTKTIIGDARLTLGKAPDKVYSYLVIDAFSSDAVPVHLLTREALALYMSKLADDGLIAFHISNRHLELESVIASTANTLPGIHMAAVLQLDVPAGFDGKRSHVVFLAKDKAVIDKVLAWKDSRPANARSTTPWSDQYADILSALWRRYTD